MTNLGFAEVKVASRRITSLSIPRSKGQLESGINLPRRIDRTDDYTTPQMCTAARGVWTPSSLTKGIVRVLDNKQFDEASTCNVTFPPLIPSNMF